MSNNSHRKEWQKRISTHTHKIQKNRKVLQKQGMEAEMCWWWCSFSAGIHVMHMHDWRLYAHCTHIQAQCNGFPVWHVHDRISWKHRQDNGKAHISLFPFPYCTYSDHSFGFFLLLLLFLCFYFVVCVFVYFCVYIVSIVAIQRRIWTRRKSVMINSFKKRTQNGAH